MEAVRVAVRPEHGVLEERERGHVGSGERVAEEVVATVEERLEAVERGRDPALELGDPPAVRLRHQLLRGDQVRRPLPDLVEPVEEAAKLFAACGVAREERRLGEALLQVLEDPRRVVQDEVAVDENGHELLAADLAGRAAVRRVDVDPLDRHALVRERERHALNVRRERNPVNAERVGRHEGTLPSGISSFACSSGWPTGRPTRLPSSCPSAAHSCPARDRARGRGTPPPTATPSARRTSR